MPVALCLCISFNILVLNEHQLNINNVFLGARTKDLHVPAQKFAQCELGKKTKMSMYSSGCSFQKIERIYVLISR